MEDIDFELCLTVEKHVSRSSCYISMHVYAMEADLAQILIDGLYYQAAIIRREKRKTPTPKVDNSNRTADGDADENADGTGAFVPGEIRGHEHGGDTHVDKDRETGGKSRPSLKRAKISASGSWCAGSTSAHNAHQQGTVEGTTSATTSFPSSGMVDTTPGPTDRINRDMPPPPPYLPLLSSAQASASAPFIMPSHPKLKPKPRIDPITSEHLNDSISFTIYEDSADRDTQDFKPDFGMGFNSLEFNMHHGLGLDFPDPEPWYSRLEDNKENTEYGLYENYEYVNDAGIDAEEGGMGALFWRGGSGVDGDINWGLNDRDIGMTTAGGFREDLRHHAPGSRGLANMRRLYHNPTVERAGFLDASAAMDVDIMNMEIRPANDNGEERGPEMHTHVENGGNQQLQDISIMGVPTAGGNWGSAGPISPSLLGAPPRRFLGRGGASRR